MFVCLYNSPMTLKEWRTLHGLTQSQAAAKLGLGGATHVSFLERGSVSPTLRIVDRIARATNGAVARRDWPEDRHEQA